MQTYRLAYDRASVRSIDGDGHLHVASSVITSACVSPYFGSEVPNCRELGLDPQKTYYLLRDAVELKKATPTLQGKPLLNTHRPQTADDHNPNIVVGSVNNPEWNDRSLDLMAELVVWNAAAIAGIQSGSERSLSAGYRYVAVMRPGTFGGTRYDGLMTQIVFNHVALVSEPRVPGAMVGDAKPKATTKTRRNLIVMDATDPGYDPNLVNDEGPDIAAIKEFVRSKLSTADFTKLCEMLGAPETTQAMDARRRDTAEANRRFNERFPDVARIRVIG